MNEQQAEKAWDEGYHAGRDHGRGGARLLNPDGTDADYNPYRTPTQPGPRPSVVCDHEPVCHRRSDGWPECAAPFLTAEQQGSDESGEGLSEAQREAADWLHGKDRPSGLDCRFSGPLGLMRALISKADDRLATARRDADELRGGLAAVEAVVPDACWTHSTPWRVATCADLIGGTFGNGKTWTEAMCCLPCRLRAALANPSAAQGEGEVDERQWSLEAEDGTTGYTSEAIAREVAAGDHGYTFGIAQSPIVAAFARANPDDDWTPLATDAPEASR